MQIIGILVFHNKQGFWILSTMWLHSPGKFKIKYRGALAITHYLLFYAPLMLKVYRAFWCIQTKLSK